MMFEEPEMDEPGCPVCLLEHDDEIHAATLSIRRWWRAQVTKNFYEDEESDSSAAA